MKRVKVLKGNRLTHQGEFDSDEQAQAWIAEQQEQLTWGLPEEYSLEVTDITSEMEEIKARHEKRQKRLTDLRALAQKSNLSNPEMQTLVLALAKQVLDLD